MNGRRPKKKMEDDLKKLMENNLKKIKNGRRPQKKMKKIKVTSKKEEEQK